jgi:hypothetical protein
VLRFAVCLAMVSVTTNKFSRDPCRLLPAISDYIDRRPEAINEEKGESR